MKSVARLREQARRHEQQEDWAAAVSAYEQAIQRSEEIDEDVDLSLYNRVGDLYLRLGKTDRAVEFYELAADRYAEQELFNNAIALCNKALRYRPGHAEIYRKLGYFSDVMGFVADARHNLLKYADARLRAGDVDAVINALQGYENLSEDAETRVQLAQRLEDQGHTDAAVRQLIHAHALLSASGSADYAQKVRARILELDPTASLDAAATPAAGPRAAAPGDDSASGPLAGLEVESITDMMGPPEESERPGADEIDLPEDDDPLPLLDPIDLGGGDAEKEEPAPAPAEALSEELAPLESIDSFEPLDSLDTIEPLDTIESIESLGPIEPLGPIEVAEPSPPAMANPPTPEPAAPKPPTPEPEGDSGGEGGEEYIDLATLLFGEDDAEAGGGAEVDDFEALMRPYRTKVLPHGAEDPGSRYDLGLAFKEMGLIDEAIAEFMAALDADGTQLKVYEELGQCFMAKAEYEIAARVLMRALDLPRTDDAGVIGVYYQLGRCQEEMGRREEARLAYERVAAVNAAFQDVAARLADL